MNTLLLLQATLDNLMGFITLVSILGIGMALVAGYMIGKAIIKE
jgi:hypothetical protein